MPILSYLAMTAAEIRRIGIFPGKTAWMACHFSPYGTGLSCLPRTLPPDSLLMVDDITPIRGHDPQHIAAQLAERAEALHCRSILLDFQRPDCPETAALVRYLCGALPCPVAVSSLYAGDVDAAVLLPPVPPSVPLEAHLAPWTGRELWLELALDGEVITLTEDGARTTPLPYADIEGPGFAEDTLHCHYQIELREDAARFTLWRTREDLKALTEEADHFGISCCIGLYQELHDLAAKKPSPGGKVDSKASGTGGLEDG